MERGEDVEITRYDRPTAIVVPPGWYEAVNALLADLEALAEWQERAAALREGRLVAGLKRQDPRVVHHIDGDARNNDPANLRLVDPKETNR